MSILKLKEVGDEATLEITACAVVEGQYGEQVQFDAGDDRLYLPKSSADRQLERIGLDYDAVVGQTLHFSRTPSTKPMGSPFWNINTVKPKANGKPPVSHSMSSKPNAQLPEFLQDAEQQDAAELSAKVGVDLGKFSKDLALYTALTEFVTTKIAPLYGNEAGIGMSPESAVAAVATLYIEAKK